MRWPTTNMLGEARTPDLQSNGRQLRSLYDAFKARDIDAVTDDVGWPNAWEGGRLHGKEAVRAYWLRQWNEIDPHVEPVSIAARHDGRVAGIARLECGRPRRLTAWPQEAAADC